MHKCILVDEHLSLNLSPQERVAMNYLKQDQD